MEPDDAESSDNRRDDRFDIIITPSEELCDGSPFPKRRRFYSKISLVDEYRQESSDEHLLQPYIKNRLVTLYDSNNTGRNKNKFGNLPPTNSSTNLYVALQLEPPVALEVVSETMRIPRRRSPFSFGKYQQPTNAPKSNIPISTLYFSQNIATAGGSLQFTQSKSKLQQLFPKSTTNIFATQDDDDANNNEERRIPGVPGCSTSSGVPQMQTASTSVPGKANANCCNLTFDNRSAFHLLTTSGDSLNSYDMLNDVERENMMRSMVDCKDLTSDQYMRKCNADLVIEIEEDDGDDELQAVVVVEDKNYQLSSGSSLESGQSSNLISQEHFESFDDGSDSESEFETSESEFGIGLPSSEELEEDAAARALEFEAKTDNELSINRVENSVSYEITTKASSNDMEFIFINQQFQLEPAEPIDNLDEPFTYFLNSVNSIDNQLKFFTEQFDVNSNFVPFKNVFESEVPVDEDVSQESYITECTEEDDLERDLEEFTDSRNSNTTRCNVLDVNSEPTKSILTHNNSRRSKSKDQLFTLQTRHGEFSMTEEECRDRPGQDRLKLRKNFSSESCAEDNSVHNTKARETLFQESIVSNLIAVANIINKNKSQKDDDGQLKVANVDSLENFKTAASSSKFRGFLQLVNQKWRKLTNSFTTLRKQSSENLADLKKAITKKLKRATVTPAGAGQLLRMDGVVYTASSRKMYKKTPITRYDRVQVTKSRKRTAMVRQILVPRIQNQSDSSAEQDNCTPGPYTRKTYSRRMVPLKHFKIGTQQNGRKRCADVRTILVRS